MVFGGGSRYAFAAHTNCVEVDFRTQYVYIWLCCALGTFAIRFKLLGHTVEPVYSGHLHVWVKNVLPYCKGGRNKLVKIIHWRYWQQFLGRPQADRNVKATAEAGSTVSLLPWSFVESDLIFQRRSHLVLDLSACTYFFYCSVNLGICSSVKVDFRTQCVYVCVHCSGWR